jgi:pimeloyl-ACP methyl ester carboxylesterase
MRYVRAYPQEPPVPHDLLSTIATPVLIINGARDPVVPPVNTAYLHERLPKSKVELIDTGHFIWEDAADTYASLVTDWWTEGYKETSRKNPAEKITTLPVEAKARL